MRTSNNTAQKQQEFLKAYKNNFCIISKACEQVKIGRHTFYDWLKNDPKFKDEFDATEPLQIEFVENELFKRIKEGSDSSIQFYLKTKGKKYGYGTNVDITSGGETLNTPTIIKLIEIKNDKDEDESKD